MPIAANPILDVEARNYQIRNPLNPNGEIQSLLDATKTLSYDRWSVSIVCGGAVTPASSHEGNRDVNTSLLEDADTISSLYMALRGHGRIIFEKVTLQRGYELIDSDVTRSTIQDPSGSEIATFRKYTNSQRTLDDITGSIGLYIETQEKVQAMLDFITSKQEEAWRAAEKIRQHEQVDNPPKFNASNPNPAANVFNCITFALEAAKAGGLDLYPLFGNLVFRMGDIRSAEELSEGAIYTAPPLELRVEGEEAPVEQRVKRLSNISYLGWNALRHRQGQFRVDEQLLKRKVDQINAWRKQQNDDLNTSEQLGLIDENYILDKMRPRNIYSLIPVANVFCGITSIFTAVFSSDEDLLVVKEQVLACRLLLFTVGVLEITWVGAIIIHGLASFYFFAKQAMDDTAISIYTETT